MADRLLNPRKKQPKSKWCHGFVLGPKATDAERLTIEGRMKAQDIRNQHIKNTR